MKEWYEIHLNSEYTSVEFNQPFKVLSSAFHNGGLTDTTHISNVKVQEKICPLKDPKFGFHHYCNHYNWPANTVGLLTSASMKSLSTASFKNNDFEMKVLVTSGLSNARCIGEPSQVNNITQQEYKAGTINTILITDLNFTDAAMVEAIMMMTEAKVKSLTELQVKSTLSGKIATGTGTDANVIACNPDGIRIDFCGKHTFIGETIGQLVLEATSNSIKNSTQQT